MNKWNLKSVVYVLNWFLNTVKKIVKLNYNVFGCLLFNCYLAIVIYIFIAFLQMVKLTPGSQVFMYQHLVQQALAKPTFKSPASYLLNCLYNNEELLGMNLSGAHGKHHPDKDILGSIIVMSIIH